ncbi:MAG: hypothetical protein ACT4PP_04945 [Sporichthyaceae bacterium]
MAREMPRVTVTLPAELVDEMRARVGPRETSAWVAGAIADRLALERLGAAISDYESEHGAITEQDIATARKRTSWKPATSRRKPPAA